MVFNRTVKKLTELAAIAQSGGTPEKTAYQLNPAIFGELYQWGRVKDGHQVRGNSAATAVAGPVPATDLDANGQVKSDGSGTSGTYYGKHVYNTSSPYDWQSPQNDALWGNRQAISYNFGSADGGAVPNTNKTAYYQKPVKSLNNDPCPSGWRLPTQDEWERLGAYGCGAPHSAGGNFSTPNGNAAIVPSNNPNTTWVRVSNGKANANADWTNPDYRATGYAIYNTAVWNAAASGYQNGALDLFADTAPEPLLFLPAAGYRSNSSGVLSYVGTNGYYWSSTVISTYAYYLYFNSSYVYPNNFYNRAYGFSVRCVAQN